MTITIPFDPARLPHLPWSIKIDGKVLIIRDACNEYVGKVELDSKACVGDVASFLEVATGAMAR